ncbi:hypothetical protein ACHAWF_005912 [Thalassiosira exigua]
MKTVAILILTAVVRSVAFSITDTSTLGAEPVRLRPDGSANDVLCSLLKDDEASMRQSLVRLDGLVSKRRAIGKHLVFLDVIPMNLPKLTRSQKVNPYDVVESMTPVQAIMRRDFWNNGTESSSTYDMYHKIIQPGVHCQLRGHAGPSRNANEAILFCHSAKYTLANDNPQHLRNVLRYVKEGDLDTNEVLGALPCIDSHDEIAKIIGLGNRANTTNTTYGEMSVGLLARFPRNYLCNPSKLMGSNSSQKVKLLPPGPPEYTTAPSFNQYEAGEEAVLSIADILRDKKQLSPNTSKQVTISGWVQNRRRYRGSISVLELVDEFSSLASSLMDDDDGVSSVDKKTKEMEDISKVKDLWKGRIYAVLHPDALCEVHGSVGDVATSQRRSEMYGNILSPGARVLLQGHLLVNSLDDVATFWVTNCRLLRSSWRLSAVRQILDLLHERKFPIDEAAAALNLSGGYAQADDIAKMPGTHRRWLAAEITQSLQGENSRVGRFSSSMEQSLRVFAYARDRYPIERVDSSTIENDSGPAREKGANKERTDESRWVRAKKPQLTFMMQQILSVLHSHPEYGRRTLKLVDIGGGKGLLSTMLAEQFGDDIVEVQVIDISHSATKNGMMRAKRLGLQNIQYDALDASALDVAMGADVVVALHACGVLTDVALGHAVCQGAGFVICPCCFQSNPHLRVPMPFGGHHVKLVPAEEWLKVDSAMYGPLKQVAELQGDMAMASKAMHTVCGIRAAAAETLWHNRKFPAEELHISIKAFPIGFSTRNLCLIGKFAKNNP